MCKVQPRVFLSLLLFLIWRCTICCPYSDLAQQPVDRKRDQPFLSRCSVVRPEMLESIHHEHHVMIERGVGRSGIITPFPASDTDPPVALEDYLLHIGSIWVERESLLGELMVCDVGPIEGGSLPSLADSRTETPQTDSRKVSRRR